MSVLIKTVQCLCHPCWNVFLDISDVFSEVLFISFCKSYFPSSRSQSYCQQNTRWHCWDTQLNILELFLCDPFSLDIMFQKPQLFVGRWGGDWIFFFFFFTASECRLFTQPDTESESSCCGGCIEFSKWVLSLRFEHHLWFWPQSGSEQQTNAHLRRCCWSVFKQAASGAVSMEIAFVTTLPTMLVPEPWPCNRCRPLTTHKRDRCWGRQHCQ